MAAAAPATASEVRNPRRVSVSDRRIQASRSFLLWTNAEEERSIPGLDPLPRREGGYVLERLSVVFDGDVQYPAWGRDGSLLAVGVSIRSSLWRFQPQTTQSR